MNEAIPGCPKRDAELILAIALLKKEFCDSQWRPLDERCTECKQTEPSCTDLVRHMELIREHLRAMEKIIHSGDTST